MKYTIEPDLYWAAQALKEYLNIPRRQCKHFANDRVCVENRRFPLLLFAAGYAIMISAG
ncbi:MAG: hypothetical protein IKI45_00575 [Oscillospiraceae bacterium]|nr:hypothetical protein [Oscillospiraceae bacterium]